MTETVETIFKLKPSRLHSGEAKIRYWYAIPEEGTPYEELFKATYWDSHRHLLAIGDFIRVEPDEGHYTADLKVVSAGIGGILVAEFYKKDWAKVAAPLSLSSVYKTKYAGPHHRWRVERIADGHVEQTGFTSESDANRWLSANSKSLERQLQAA